MTVQDAVEEDALDDESPPKRRPLVAISNSGSQY
jgi:hypothetical protein